MSDGSGQVFGETAAMLTLALQLAQATAEAPASEDGGVGGLWRGLVLLVGIGFLSYFLLFKTRRRIAQRQRHDDGPASNRINAQAQAQRDITNRVNELMAELADLSRQINGQLDTRLTRAELLIRDLDDRITMLQHLQKGGPHSGPDRASSDQPSTPVELVEDEKPGYEAPAKASESTPANTENDENIPPEGRPDVLPPQLPQAQEILDLAEKGMDARAIAQTLDRPVGEVELVLSLSGRSK